MSSNGGHNVQVVPRNMSGLSHRLICMILKLEAAIC